MMGFLSKLFVNSGAVGDTLKTASSVVREVRNTFAKKLPPDEQAEFDLNMLRIEAELGKSQIEVNKTEAQHSSIFVAGWRPMLGWCLSIAIGLNVLIRPILSIFGINIPDIPPAAFTLMNILLGVVVGTRTLEKFGKVQDKH